MTFLCKNLSKFVIDNETWPINDPCTVELINVLGISSYSYFIILFLIYLRWSPVNQTRSHHETKLLYGHNCRHLLLLVQFLINLAEAGDYILSGYTAWYAKLIPATSFITNIMSQIFYYKLEKHGKVQFIIVTILFWLLCGCCRGLLFLTMINLKLPHLCVRHVTSLLNAIVCYLIAWNDISTLYNLYNERNKIKVARLTSYGAYKYSTCNWYSKITFYWITNILHLGYSTPLEPEHFGSLPDDQKSNVQYNKLMKTYSREKAIPTSRSDDVVSLWKCFLKCHWKQFILGGFLKLLGDVIGLIPALGISVVVKYVEKVQNNTETKTEISYTNVYEFYNNGYIMAVIVLVTSLVQGTLSQNSTHIINTEGIKLKNSLQGLIYQKLLRIQRNHLKMVPENSTDNIGFVTNLMMEDAHNIMSCFWIAHYIWAIPLKIILLIYLLYQEIGISSLISSIICIVIMLPLQFIMGKKMSENHKITTEWNDKRLRKMNEILQGIRFIKLYCLEKNFTDNISNLRNNELKHLNMDSVYWAVITFLTNASSVVIAVLTIVLYYYIDDSPILASSVFTSLALFNQLTVPLFIFPIMVPIVISANVSVKRIQIFLASPEVHKLTQVSNFSTEGEKLNKAKEVKKEDQVLRLRKITENSENEEEVEEKPNKDINEILRANKIVCSWSDPLKLFLQIDNMVIQKGTINFIIGKESSGKTSLLSALLGEMICFSGKIRWHKNTKIAYVPQETWLMNDTVKENILFGCPYNEKHFKAVVRACSLQQDINLLPDKEYAVIGNQGVKLSGGQKQRIMIARAIYSNADVILMDSPFASLDSQVANHIFEYGIKELLVKQQKTVIMVTNDKKFLPHCNQVIIMGHGKIKASGTYVEMLKTKMCEICDTKGTNSLQMRKSSDQENIVSNLKFWPPDCLFVPLKRRQSTQSGSRYFTHDLPLPTDDCDVDVFEGDAHVRQKKRLRAATVTEYPESTASHKAVFRVSSLQASRSNVELHKAKFKDCSPMCDWHRQTYPSDASCNDDEADPLMFDDHAKLKTKNSTNAEKNKKIKIYMAYVKSCGLLTALAYCLLTVAWQAVRILTDFWLSRIISSNDPEYYSNEDTKWYFFIYMLLSILALVMSFSSTAMGQYAGSKARRTLHRNMLLNIVKCPVYFFDNTPIGHTINRFSMDTDVLDKKIATSTQRLIQFQLLCITAILVNCIITPWFIILVIPITLIYYMVQNFYRSSNRELQHLDSVTKSPIISHISETFSGLEVIRAFNAEDRFLNLLFRKIDVHTNVYLVLNSINRWLGISLDYSGGLIVFAAMLVALVCITLDPQITTSAFIGLAINYTLLLPIYLTWVVKFLADLEIFMGAVERINQYAKLETENYNKSAIVPLRWPSKGTIEFIDVTLRYTNQGHPVIRNLNLKIEAGQKVGVCGRTGSGKSSLLMSLFRMISKIDGDIIIDYINTSDVPLQLLRSKIAVVPQDVILFSGTIRQNLDLRREFTDNELWKALRIVNVQEVVMNKGGLGAQVQDGGCNFSNGEKQLLCLAKAILQKTYCLILDEATSALPSVTEADFLTMVLQIFAECTVIVVTHRVSSLVNFNRILLLDNGLLAEDGSPAELLNKRNSMFSSLMKHMSQQ